MNARFFDTINWQQPWLDVLKPVANAIVQADDWRMALNDVAMSAGLRNHAGLPVRFVPQSELPPGTAYEAFIYATGGVPTRENLHDFFNALVWLTFPRIKAQLNALQAAEIARSIALSDTGVASVSHRGKLRDGATIFDENAALLITSNVALVAMLRNHQWREAFITRRDLFDGRACDIRLFGHALMEKLMSPYKAITAHAWVVIVDDSFFAMTESDKLAWLDATVAIQLADSVVTTAFTPLPVLGVPGWWGGQDDTFYEDVSVFRPRRI